MERHQILRTIQGKREIICQFDRPTTRYTTRYLAVSTLRDAAGYWLLSHLDTVQASNCPSYVNISIGVLNLFCNNIWIVQNVNNHRVTDQVRDR